MGYIAILFGISIAFGLLVLTLNYIFNKLFNEGVFNDVSNRNN